MFKFKFRASGPCVRERCPQTLKKHMWKEAAERAAVHRAEHSDPGQSFPVSRQAAAAGRSGAEHRPPVRTTGWWTGTELSLAPIM